MSGSFLLLNSNIGFGVFEQSAPVDPFVPGLFPAFVMDKTMETLLAGVTIGLVGAVLGLQYLGLVDQRAMVSKYAFVWLVCGRNWRSHAR